MSEASDSVECPSCGSRNKLSWEFCARCGESLAGSELEAAAAEAADEPVAAARVESSSWLPFLFGSALAIAAGIALWRSGWARTDPPRPSASIFQLAPADRVPQVLPYPRGATLFAAARQKLAQGDVAAALKLFEEALEIEPHNAEFHSVYGQALLNAGRKEEALTQMREAARLSPGTHQVFLARYLFVVGRPAEALREYETLLAATPDDYVAAREYATLLGEAGDYAKAATALKRVAAALPEDMNLQASLAYALEQSGDAEGATAVYNSLLQKNKSHAGVRVRLADLVFAQGQAQQAVQIYSDGLSLNPNDAMLHRGIGEILERTGDLRGAAEHYRAYARLDPKAPQAGRLAARADALEMKADREG